MVSPLERSEDNRLPKPALRYKRRYTLQNTAVMSEQASQCNQWGETGIKNKQGVLGRANRLLSFDTTLPAYKTTHPKILLCCV
jgi:hypothetical protein